MKIALVTAVYGGFDHKLELPDQALAAGDTYDRFYFTDKDDFLFREGLSSRLRAKWFKLQMHNIHALKDYDTHIWIDGNFQIKNPGFIAYMARQLNNYDAAMVLHPQRKCVYQECQEIIRRIDANDKYIMPRYGAERDLMVRQEHDYREMGLPENWGLFASGIFAVKNIPLVRQAMDMAWIDCIRYTSQDQNSIPVYLWKYGVNVNRLSISITDCAFWHLNHHA